MECEYKCKDGEKILAVTDSKIIVLRANGNRRVLSRNSGEIMTKQSFERECDVNHILARHRATGLPLPQGGQGLDVSEVGDFMDVLAKREKAARAFDEMPPELRKRFKTPSDVLEFVSTNGIKALNDLVSSKVEAVKSDSKVDAAKDAVAAGAPLPT